MFIIKQLFLIFFQQYLGVMQVIQTHNIQEINQYNIFDMTALNSQINYFMKRALEINKKIGGRTAYYSQDKNKDKFIALKQDVEKGFYYIKEKFKEKEKKRVGAEHIKIDNEIKDKIVEIQTMLQRMNEYMKKNAKSNTEKNNATYEFLRGQLAEYKDIVQNGGQTNRSAKGQLNLTITDVRSQLLQQGSGNKKGKQTNKRIRKEDQKMSQVELEATDRWKKNDQLIDKGLDKLIDKTQEWKKKTIAMGEAIDTTTKQIDKLDSKVDAVNVRLVNANKQLKSVVQKFRKPHRFCLDVVLILILLGLIVGIVKVSQKK